MEYKSQNLKNFASKLAPWVPPQDITTVTITETLPKLSESMNATRVRETKANPDSNALKLLNLLWDRSVILQGKVDQTNTDYSLHLIHSKVKRGLLNIVGKASKYLYGTGTEDDIHDLREHYNHVLSYAANDRQVINLNHL